MSELVHSLPGGSKLSESAFGYFITACAVVILAILCYLALPWMVSRWGAGEASGFKARVS